MGHALSKKAILHLKMATVRFDLNTAVCNFVINELNPTSEVQNIGNGAFQNAPFANIPFANGMFSNSDYSCLWA